MKRGFLYTISAFAVSVVFLTSLSFLYTDRLTAYINSRNAIDRSQQLIIQLYRLAYYVREMERNHRSFLLSRDSAFLKEFDSVLVQVNVSRDSLESLIDSQNALRVRFNKLQMSIVDRIAELQRTLHESALDSFDVVQAILKNHPLRTTLIQFIQVMEQEETKELNAHMQKRQSYERVNRADFQMLFFFALLIFIISLVVLLREIRLRMLYHERMESEIKLTNQANKELERITFIASHDLQEPLRKIRTFSNLLGSKYGAELQEEGKSIIQRIEHSADVMQELIRDLAHYTNLVSHNQHPRKTDLNEVLQDVRTKFAARLEQSHAKLTVDWLPVINGYPEQLFMLFSALLDNSLKFSRPGVSPEISVTHESIKGELVPDADERKHYINFHKITFSDNGLGFDEEFAEKIFGMFQRLHNLDAMFSGRGMGLAIAKRVMLNHNGHIMASGSPGGGADFYLYFPA
jgi:signal transduction histidine kinase